jgi:DNA segregation ATPase FtsK/SpoIIIE, S-DNA-T family
VVGQAQEGVLSVARARTVAPKRRRVRRTARSASSNPFLIFDVCGVGLIVLGLATGVALYAENTSGYFRYVAAALHVTFGVGAYVVPLLLVLVGIKLIVGPLKLVPRNASIGTLLIFAAVVTWVSLTDRLSPTYALYGGPGRGGYLGDGLSWLLRKATGDLIGYFVLVGIAAIGVVMIVDAPISSVIERLRTAGTNWREAAIERAELRELARTKEVVVRVKEAQKVEEVGQESRKRTLARIFGKDANGKSEAEPPPDLELTRPPVKINGGVKEPAPGIVAQIEMPAEQGEYHLPPITLLHEPPPPPARVESELKENIETIERTLAEFKVEANVVEICHGPTVARYEIRLAPGIKVNKIVGLADNLAMSLSAIDVRVEAPIPGKAAIGVEVPNRNRSTVVLREVVESKAFRDNPSKLAFALGKDVAGRAVAADLGKMPHMLVGGATNAGKSVGLNSLIASLLFRVTPDELKMVLIDPKRVELSMFDGIPHLACPVVKDARQAAGIFRSVVKEMENRYLLLAQKGARNIDGYNERAGEGEKMPYIVVVVDELCDLMMQAAAEVEGSITRLAQLARATGIHLVIATQRPSVDVITGVIKANIPSRIAFATSSHHDSRTILDQIGAERLIGRGDMLFLPIDASKPTRIQGCYISEKEIEAVCNFLKEQRKPVYTITPSMVGESGGGGGGDDDAFADEFYEPSVRFVVNTGYCSTSMLQRKFKIGYTRAARIVDAMEQNGIVGPLDGAGTKGRQVLVSKADLESMLGGHLGFAPDEEEDEKLPEAEIIYPDEAEEEEDR